MKLESTYYNGIKNAICKNPAECTKETDLKPS